MPDLPTVHWKTGFEIELLAPAGKTRQDLALAIAAHYGASVRRIFYTQGEPSKVPGTPVFENLTLGFVVENDQGELLAQCVDDLTLQTDLDRQRPPRPDWYRIVSDDSRLLRLTRLNTDAERPLSTVLQPIADLYGTALQVKADGMVRVVDETGASIAIGAPLPGERERPCELITPPIEHDHYQHLAMLLELARSLGFTVPAEGATHIHFDAKRLCRASTLVNLVNILDRHGAAMKQHFGTNPNCRRLGAWPQALLDLVRSPEFIQLPWEEARLQLAELKLTKYCDFNLRNLVHNTPDKHTFEVRILPVWLEPEPLVEAAAFFTGILEWAENGDEQLKPVPENFEALRKLAGLTG